MKLNNRQTRHLKALAHSLKPVVTVGQRGLTDNVHEEIQLALARHELIKVKIPAGPREGKDAICDEIASASKSTRIALTGRTLILFKQKSPDKTRITLP